MLEPRLLRGERAAQATPSAWRPAAMGGLGGYAWQWRPRTAEIWHRQKSGTKHCLPGAGSRAGDSPAQRTLDAAERRIRWGMAVSAAFPRLQPCWPALLSARFPRFLTAEDIRHDLLRQVVQMRAVRYAGGSVIASRRTVHGHADRLRYGASALPLLHSAAECGGGVFALSLR